VICLGRVGQEEADRLLEATRVKNDGGGSSNREGGSKPAAELKNMEREQTANKEPTMWSSVINPAGDGHG